MWVNRYIGKRWTQEQDCGYWFRRIQKEQFDRIIPEICNVPSSKNKFCRQAMHIMEKIKREIETLNWKKTDQPIEGDAVMLALRSHIHHIGIVIFLNNQLHILHALEQCGVIVSSKTNIQMNGLRIEGYYTYGS